MLREAKEAEAEDWVSCSAGSAFWLGQRRDSRAGSADGRQRRKRAVADTQPFRTLRLAVESRNDALSSRPELGARVYPTQTAGCAQCIAARTTGRP